MVRVLIVDDSSFARLSISKHLETDPDIEIIGFARDGYEAIEKTKELKPNVITMDVEMPRMDGLEALGRIMAEEPTPVVMLSSLTEKGSEITVRALEMGAVDFFLKPNSTNPAGFFTPDNNLNSKIKLSARIGKTRLIATRTRQPAPPPQQKKYTNNPSGIPRNVIVIGSSTGGPGALYEVVPHLEGDIPAAVLLVQHMPPVFTKSLAERLDTLSNLSVKEAEQGDQIREGQALLAPGNFHMEAKRDHKVAINQKPPVVGLRPCVDITMQSAALTYGAKTIGVILTGMGSDGTKGAASIKRAGGVVAAQDEASCVVYGMPRSAAESGNVDKVVPLTRMAGEIMELCRK